VITGREMTSARVLAMWIQMTANTLNALPPEGFCRLGGEWTLVLVWIQLRTVYTVKPRYMTLILVYILHQQREGVFSDHNSWPGKTPGS
jgi:hypothetical protein